MFSWSYVIFGGVSLIVAIAFLAACDFIRTIAKIKRYNEAEIKAVKELTKSYNHRIEESLRNPIQDK